MGSLVLIVEDDLVMAKLVARALQRAGYEYISAPTASEALKAFGDHDIDLVVMDLFLPDGDGLAVCQHLHQVHDTPVVMVSCLEEDLGAGVVGTELGPQAFFAKPFHFSELVEMIRTLLPADDGAAAAEA